MWPTHYIPNQPRVEGEPPPRYYLTSPPYPLEVFETLAAAGGEFVGGSFGLGSGEDIECAAAFVSGEMITYGYVEIAAEDEIECAAAFVSGALVVRLVQAEVGPDEIECAAAFVDGELRDSLVRYQNWPLGAADEDLLGAAFFVSGVLT